MKSNTSTSSTANLAVLSILLFVCTAFVNKYVLSVLKFTYPTIFQGWQTLVGALVLKMLTSTRWVDPLLKDVSRTQLALMLPGMMFFVGSIYSGSKALAVLPVPVFFALTNLIIVVKYTGNLMMGKKLSGVMTYLMLMLTVVSSVAVIQTDPQFRPEGYFWICIHIITTGGLEIYTTVMSDHIKLTSVEQLYCCYIYSVIVLAPCSYFLGDALEAVKFPYLYFAKFYCGCILSGMFGIFLNLCLIRLAESELSAGYVQLFAAIAKICGSLLSLVPFPTTLTANFTFWLMVNHLSAAGCAETIPAVTETNGAVPSQKLTSSGPLQRHTLQKDFLRIDIGQ